MRFVKLVVALALANLLLAGCGGMSKEELVSKANAICQKAESDFDKVKQPSSLSDPAAASKYFDQLVPIAEKQLNDLRALEPPDEIKANYDAFVAANDRFVKQLKELVAAAKAKDAQKGVKLAGDLQTTAKEATEKAKSAGLTQCAS
jgi:hypothetical protein